MGSIHTPVAYIRMKWTEINQRTNAHINRKLKERHLKIRDVHILKRDYYMAVLIHTALAYLISGYLKRSNF